MKIKFNEKELNVTEVYPYQYTNGKECLRIKVSEDDHNYEDVAALKEFCGTIEQYEGTEKKCDYEGYTEDYRVTYSGGVWSVELTRKTEEQRTIEMHEAAIIELASMVAELGQVSNDSGTSDTTENSESVEQEETSSNEDVSLNGEETEGQE